MGKKRRIFLLSLSALVLAQCASALSIGTVDLGLKSRPIGQVIWTAILASGGMLLAAEFIAKRMAIIGGKLGPVLGITLLAMATSMPELAVSITGAMSGQFGVVIGNAIGSNIANIALVLGIVAIIKPVKIEKGMTKTFLAIVFLSVPVATMLYAINLGGGMGYMVSRASALAITQDEGILLIAAFVVYILISYLSKAGEMKEEEGSALISALLVVVGVAFLILTAKVTVDALLRIALHYKFSEMVVGSTLIAVGTSLPELAVCLVLVLRDEGDLLFGNLVASNVFDATFALGAAALIATIAVPGIAIGFHVPAMMLLNVVVLFLVMKEGIGRTGGIILVAMYAVYTALTLTGGFGLL